MLIVYEHAVSERYSSRLPLNITFYVDHVGFFFLNKCGKMYACWKIHVVCMHYVWVCIVHCPGCFFHSFLCVCM